MPSLLTTEQMDKDMSFQIVSDLKILQPKALRTTIIKAKAKYLALLGNIGIVDDDYIEFIKNHLEQFEIVFLVLGTLEPNGDSWDEVKEKLHKLE